MIKAIIINEQQGFACQISEKDVVNANAGGKRGGREVLVVLVVYSRIISTVCYNFLNSRSLIEEGAVTEQVSDSIKEPIVKRVLRISLCIFAVAITPPISHWFLNDLLVDNVSTLRNSFSAYCGGIYLVINAITRW